MCIRDSFWNFQRVSWRQAISTRRDFRASASSRLSPVKVHILRAGVHSGWVWTYFFNQPPPWIGSPCPLFALVKRDHRVSPTGYVLALFDTLTCDRRTGLSLGPPVGFPQCLSRWNQYAVFVLECISIGSLKELFSNSFSPLISAL